ncbi:o-succinylbenzoate synthase [Weissella viridescens]|uniref:O-succinylbenzoate synthase n=1 Tax=Weissella viridescens TaxID=1629 RepID=A0A3P2RDT0_WEIVI|nr:enolase C-terminal domain-like protein [Weissella viridescens]RRG18823.1 o-succinylbenzoate synthase [Weissella viridescens]
MQIAQIRAIPFALPLKQAFKTAHDTTQLRELTLLEVTLSNGCVGYGEIQSFMNTAYAPETQVDSREMLAEVASGLKNFDWQHPSAIATYLAERTSLTFVRAAIEMACWDAYGKTIGTSLAAMLGAQRQSVPVGKAVGIQDDAAATIAEIERLAKTGYQRAKLKLTDPEQLLDLSGLQQRYPQLVFSIDFNNALPDTDASYQMLQRLKNSGITLVEEPLKGSPWQRYAAMLTSGLVPKISLDESINGVADIELALQQHVANAFTLKQGKLGGITATQTAIERINQAGQLPWIGGMLSSGLGRFVDVSLAATLSDPIFPADIATTQDGVIKDIINEPIVLHDGQVEVPQAPGIGVTLNWNAIRQMQVEPEQIY